MTPVDEEITRPAGRVGLMVKVGVPLILVVMALEGVIAAPTTPLIEEVVVEMLVATISIVNVVVADCAPDVPVIV